MYLQRDVHIKEEISSGQPSNSSPLLPEIKFSQNTLVSNNLYTEECAGNLPHTSVLTQAPLPASAPPTNVAFFNSEQGECFLPEELEAAHSDSSVVDQDAGYVDFRRNCFNTYFNNQLYCLNLIKHSTCVGYTHQMGG